MSVDLEALRAKVLAFGADLAPVEGMEGVFIRRLSLGELDGLSELEAHAGLVLLSLALCDAQERLLFGAGEVASVMGVRPDAYAALYRQALEHNRLTRREADAGDTAGVEGELVEGDPVEAALKN